jgi:formylglycine-generating enzyme required for sulfatase activity/curved DNA-binding protein CbpA
MVDNQDYYSILGVPRDASEAEIRRAFRARAKTLHPDGKPADEREEAQAEFTLLTEAYETLRDSDRRAAYDEELYFSQQLAAAGGRGGRPRSFVRGLATGFFVAALAIGIGVKVYIDRAGIGTAPKSQDSLSAQKEDREDRNVAASAPETERTKSVQPDRPQAVTDMGSPQENAAPPERVPDAASPQSQTAAAQEGAKPQSEPQAGPAINASAEKLASAQLPSSPEVSGAAGSVPAPLQPGPPGAKEAKLLPPPPEAPHSALAKAVLSIEKAIDSGGGDIETYRLVSLVNSSNSIEALSVAALLARRHESRELIANRIAALKNEQNKPAAGAPEPRAAPLPELASGSRARGNDGGKIEIAAGQPGAETTLRLSPGRGLAESFSDCPSCPEMVVIPSGQSIIGSRPEIAGFRPEEAPAHKITIRKPLAVSKRWISAENWRACVDNGVCRPILSSVLSAGPGVPATRVTWFDAKDYVEWLSRITGHRYRLLSEAEWEYAAQASAGREAGAEARAENPPAGPPADLGFSRLDGAARRWTAAKPNAWGLAGLQGSVLEWVEDCWHPAYTQAPSDGSPWLSGAGGDCAYRIVRGTELVRGDPGRRRFTARAREFAETSSPALGFRAAREIPLAAKTALSTLPAGAGKTLPAD